VTPPVASHRRVSDHAGCLRATGLAVAALAAALAPGVTGADTAAAAPRTDPADAVRQQVVDLYQQAEAATEAYDATEERIGRLEAAVAGESARAAQLRDDLGAATSRVGLLAAQQYRDAAVNPAVALLFAAHPDSYLQKAAISARLADMESRRVADVRADQRDLDELCTQAAGELAELRAARLELATHRAAVQSKLTAARDRLYSLGAVQRRQVTAALAEADGLGGLMPGAGPTLDSLLATARSAAAAQLYGPKDLARVTAAIGAAYAELGKPYVWGATGPDDFDCSGLTQHVWGQAGVQLPRTSQEQALAGSSVPLSQIRPGDLVVYFSGHTHIAIYVGQGLVIHAPRPGSVVRFAALASMPVAQVVRPAG
jgi:cell wall-associated NlpC family hydrolase